MNIMEEMRMKIMSDLNINKFSDNEKKKFAYFKYFLQNPSSSKKIIKIFSDDKSLTRLYNFSLLLNKIKKENLFNKTSQDEQIGESYKNILKQSKKLAIELKLNNSLEIATLYTYLLWNGFFSKEKSLSYSVSDIKSSFYKDIMSGTGVCSNFSDMLTDFMNEFDFSAATVINYMNNKCKTSTKLKLNRKVIKESFSSKIVDLFFYPYSRIMGNHAFNLIKENNNLYIYDATNLSIIGINSKYEAKYLGGEGVIKLHPYHSYVDNFSEKSIATLDSLHKNLSFNSPCNLYEFALLNERCLDLFIANTNLFNDFYEEIKQNIDDIDKVNRKQKQLLI